MKARRPKNIWIIFDPSGPHLFENKDDAWAIYKRGERLRESVFNSLWDMSEPIEYTIKRGKG